MCSSDLEDGNLFQVIEYVGNSFLHTVRQYLFVHAHYGQIDITVKLRVEMVHIPVETFPRIVHLKRTLYGGVLLQAPLNRSLKIPRFVLRRGGAGGAHKFCILYMLSWKTWVFSAVLLLELS